MKDAPPLLAPVRRIGESLSLRAPVVNNVSFLIHCEMETGGTHELAGRNIARLE